MAYKQFILVCAGTGCESSRADQIFRNLNTEAEKAGVTDEVEIIKTGCFGFCEAGPIVKVLPEESFYVGVKPEDAHEIIAEQLVKGRELSGFFTRETVKRKKVLPLKISSFIRSSFA